MRSRRDRSRIYLEARKHLLDNLATAAKPKKSPFASVVAVISICLSIASVAVAFYTVWSNIQENLFVNIRKATTDYDTDYAALKLTLSPL